MTQPVAEPSDSRALSGVEYRTRQLARRPSLSPAGGLAVHEIKAFEDWVPVAVGDDRFVWEVPEDLDGALIVKVAGFISTSGTEATEVAIRLGAPGAAGSDILTDKIIIEAGEYNSKDATTQPNVVANTIASWGQHLHIDVDAAGTGAMGLGIHVIYSSAATASVVLQGAQGSGGGVDQWLGSWTTSTSYTIGDAVTHNGVTYVSITNHTSDATNEPGVGVDWEDHWMLLIDDLAFHIGIQAIIRGGAYPIDPGVKAHLPIPYDCEIIEATLLADAAGSTVVDLWTDGYGNFPPTDADSITAATPLTLTAQNKTTNTALTGWDTTLSAGDVLTVHLDSISDINLLTVGLKLLRTGAGPGGGGGGGGGSGTDFSHEIAQTGHGLAVGDVVRLDGADYVVAQADSAANAEVVGIVTAAADADNFTLLTGGHTGAVLSGLTAGTVYFLDPSSAGALTSTEPTAVGDVSKPVLIADATDSGYFFNMRGLLIEADGGGGGGGEGNLWSLFPADEPPVSPDAYDDEFDGTSSVTWSWLNQDNATWTQVDDPGYGLIFNPNTDADGQWHGREQTVSGNWDFVMKFQQNVPNANYFELGLFARNTSNGRLVLAESYGASGTRQLQHSRWNSVSSFSGASGVITGYINYLRLVYDGTNITSYYSSDGLAWTGMHSETVASFLGTPDRVGFALQSSNGSYHNQATIYWFRKVA